MEAHRPPLTLALFDRNRVQYRFIGDYGAASGLVRPIQRRLAKEKNLERVLGDLQKEATEDPYRNFQLLAVKFYLRDFIADSSRQWWKSHETVTTYAEFVDQIRAYSYKKAQNVCYVTFNWDLLLDWTLEVTGLRDLSTTDGYIASNGPWYIKVHGSVNWKRVTGLTTRSPLSANEAMDHVYRHGALDSNLGYIVNSDPYWARQIAAGEPNLVLLPAIAIPVEHKDNSHFEMPEGHREVMLDSIRHATKILTIGWRGSEEHFNDLLKNNISGPDIPITTVCGTGNAGETIKNLKSLGFQNIRDSSCGFNEFVENGGLIDFLEDRV